MGHSRGLRSGTRYAFSRNFKKKGPVSTSTFLTQFKTGDIVDIKVNGAQQKGMPYKYYHGKTGVVFNVTKSAVGVIINKPVGNRYIEKRVSVRMEHIQRSRSREDFIKRVKENAEKTRKAKAEGVVLNLKRQPAMPREARTVSMEGNLPETVTPIPYETTI